MNDSLRIFSIVPLPNVDRQGFEAAMREHVMLSSQITRGGQVASGPLLRSSDGHYRWFVEFRDASPTAGFAEDFIRDRLAELERVGVVYQEDDLRYVHMPDSE